MGPETLLWMSTTNNNATTIISSSGSQQGDVAGSLSYALGLHPFLLGLDDILRNNKQTDENHYINKCYVDDGIIRASTIALFLALDYYLQEGPKFGIYLRKDKTKILLGKCSTNLEANLLLTKLTNIEGDYQLSTSNVMLHPDNDGSRLLYGIQLLGSPIGTDEFQIQFLTEKITKIQEESQKLIALENNQIKFLLYHNASIQKSITYSVLFHQT